MCFEQSNRCHCDRMGATFAFVSGYSSASFIDWWIHEPLPGNTANGEHILTRERGWRKFWWKRTACVADGVTLRKIGRAPGCVPSATWSLGLLLPEFSFISLAVPVTLARMPLLSLCLSLLPSILAEPHADCLGHCVIGGHFSSAGSAVGRSELQCCP